MRAVKNLATVKELVDESVEIWAELFPTVYDMETPDNHNSARLSLYMSYLHSMTPDLPMPKDCNRVMREFQEIMNRPVPDANRLQQFCTSLLASGGDKIFQELIDEVERVDTDDD